MVTLLSCCCFCTFSLHFVMMIPLRQKKEKESQRTKLTQRKMRECVVCSSSRTDLQREKKKRKRGVLLLTANLSVLHLFYLHFLSLPWLWMYLHLKLMKVEIQEIYRKDTQARRREVWARTEVSVGMLMMIEIRENEYTFTVYSKAAQEVNFVWSKDLLEQRIMMMMRRRAMTKTDGEKKGAKKGKRRRRWNPSFLTVCWTECRRSVSLQRESWGAGILPWIYPNIMHPQNARSLSSLHHVCIMCIYFPFWWTRFPSFDSRRELHGNLINLKRCVVKKGISCTSVWWCWCSHAHVYGETTKRNDAINVLQETRHERSGLHRKTVFTLLLYHGSLSEKSLVVWQRVFMSQQKTYERGWLKEITKMDRRRCFLLDRQPKVSHATRNQNKNYFCNFLFVNIMSRVVVSVDMIIYKKINDARVILFAWRW